MRMAIAIFLALAKSEQIDRAPLLMLGLAR
jgi:hypothetical protein